MGNISDINAGCTWFWLYMLNSALWHYISNSSNVLFYRYSWKFMVSLFCSFALLLHRNRSISPCNPIKTYGSEERIFTSKQRLTTPFAPRRKTLSVDGGQERIEKEKQPDVTRIRAASPLPIRPKTRRVFGLLTRNTRLE